MYAIEMVEVMPFCHVLLLLHIVIRARRWTRSSSIGRMPVASPSAVVTPTDLPQAISATLEPLCLRRALFTFRCITTIARTSSLARFGHLREAPRPSSSLDAVKRAQRATRTEPGQPRLIVGTILAKTPAKLPREVKAAFRHPCRKFIFKVWHLRRVNIMF